MTKLTCNIYHETDGHCCGDICPDDCLLQDIRIPPPLQANANLNRWHLLGLMVAMFSIFGWGFYTLEKQLERAAPTLEASRTE